jgi:ElaB/YqjD/DUF883 family membrane-anchored ribosome-binding protein
MRDRDIYPEPNGSTPFLQADAASDYDRGVSQDYGLPESDISEDEKVETETEAIREDIEQTRAEMARTVDEIQARLTPANIVEQVKEQAKETATEAIDNVKQTVRDATVGKVENMVNSVSDSARETGSGLMGLIKENPIPAALAGLGLGWLYMKRQNNPEQHRSNVPMGFSQNTGYAPNYPYMPPSVPVRSYTPSNYGSSSGSNSGGGLVDKVMQNPLPAAVAGLSLGYIFMKGQGGSSSSSYNYSSYGSSGSQHGLSNVTDKVGNVAGQAAGTVGNIAGSAVGTVGDIAGGTAEKVGDIAGTAAGTVGGIASGAAETVGDIASGAAGAVGNIASGAGDVAGNVVGGVQHGAQRATTQLERMLQDNPLAVGGVALVMGAVIGMMLPATEKENQILGKAHDNLMEKAGEAVQQTMDKVSNVTEQVTNTVKEEAKNQGLAQ